MNLDSHLRKLEKPNQAIARIFPGERPARQPVHTVYGGAQLFQADTANKIGIVAQKTLKEFAPTQRDFERIFGASTVWEKVHERVSRKLSQEAVEDFRIDFEDGFGIRPDQEEDETAARTAQEVATGLKNKTLPPFIGIRIKNLGEELKKRSLRTLDIFFRTLGEVPRPFFVTLPKITHVDQVSVLADFLNELERELKIAPGAISIELMIELTQTLWNQEGHCQLRKLAEAARGRCTGAHFGTYDYTASCSITAAHQNMEHPSCDFAKMLMQTALGSTGVWLSDGATNVMPVGDAKAVESAWRLSYSNIRHSLRQGFYQGWDLHPAQLPVRYAAGYSFFLESLEPVSRRLKNFVEQAARATLVGNVFDDAATGQGLLNFFLRGISSGALSESDAMAAGLTLDELRTRSFLKILEGRRSD